MFDGGVPDQFHQFIASRTSIPLPLSFPHHGVALVSSPPPTFAAACLESHPHPLFPLPPPSHNPYHHHQLSSANKVEQVKEEATGRLLPTNMMLERERSDHSTIGPWTNDEVLALLRIRSSLETWFPDFTWEDVSRKLAEVGFQRSAEKCKEKFEEESRHFGNISYSRSNNRIFSDLDELYHGENPEVSAEESPNLAKVQNEKEAEEEVDHNIDGDAAFEENLKEIEKEKIKSTRKRKRKHKQLETFKGFCEAIVKKIVAQQEELHNKLVEDMIRRDEENIAREEAWKNQEIERINKEIERRAEEQAIAGDRQAKIIEFLKKFTQDFAQDHVLQKKIQDLIKVTNGSSPTISASCAILPPSIYTTSHLSNPTFLQSQNLSTISSYNETTVSTSAPKATSSSLMPVGYPDDSITGTKVQQKMNNNNVPLVSPPSSRDGLRSGTDVGKRWPRDEVLALIKLRCNISNSEDASSKGPLWERISQMMLKLGYKRSAKRCKEKWENINKYFRKTKDNQKRRSIESRTCPYFHQLSSLYSQGKLVGQSDAGKPLNFT